MPTKEELETAVKNACDLLVEHDIPLFERDVNERSFSHKFAVYLQQEVDTWGEQWDVDCEFNRDAGASDWGYIKKLNLPARVINSLNTSIDDEHARTVFPDVIVHRRGSTDNLVVIEIKKDTARAGDIDFDIVHKLPAYVDQLGYRAAAFVLLKMGGVSYEVNWLKSLG